MSIETGPSPTKRAHLPIELGPVEDIRGSFQRQASTEFVDAIRQKAINARYTVARGQLGAGTSRRALAATQSEPVLSFSSHRQTEAQAGGFQTVNDTLEAVFGAGPRSNELRPMYETGPPTELGSARTSSFASLSAAGSDAWNPSTGSFQTRETTTEGASADTGLGHDGFDLDEVFGAEPESQVGPDAQQDSQGTVSSTDTARTVTQRFKRAFEEDVVEQSNNEDEDMADTDVEDEAEDAFKPMWHAPVGRRLAGRRGLAKTMSMPAELFRDTSF